MQALQQSIRATERVLGSRAATWEAVLATVAAAHGLRDDAPDLAELDPWRYLGAAERLGAVHESLLENRHGSGAFYTPPALVDWLLDRTLTPDVIGVLDPACGTGNVLLAVVRRLVAGGVDPLDAVSRVHGTDLDAVAVAIARLLLQIEAPGSDPDIQVADGLVAHPEAPFDLVVGNPPFLAQLRTATARTPTAGLGPYTDLSAVFLHRALAQLRDGGLVALVQPISLLAARDAAPVRAAVRERGAVTAFWSSARPVFADAAVLTCVPVIAVGRAQGPVSTWHGPDFAAGPDVVVPDAEARGAEWGPLAAPAAGVPSVSPVTDGTVGDLATCTADFRNQYYGLVPFVSDGGGGAPLVTAGLIGAAHPRWGERTTRFAKTTYSAPAVDLAALHEDGALSAWATRRLVPKLLVATQGRVIEAVVDVDGSWLPSVPVITVVPDPQLLWHLLAVLLAPPVVASAAARYLGTALSPRAIKLSAAQVATLPLPADRAAWDAGAALAQQTQQTPSQRARLLAQTAATMCRAYRDHAALEWWLDRCGNSDASPPGRPAVFPPKGS